MSDMTLYFAKININSHIHIVYENGSNEKKYILDKLFHSISSDVNYTKTLPWTNPETEEVYEKEIFYEFTSIDIFDNSIIVGGLVRTAELFFSVKNDAGDLERKSVPNSEAIQFYFDAYKEIVVFYTTQRFKYRDFTEVFEKLINISINKQSDTNYHFEVTLIKKPTDFIEFHESLKDLKNIEEIRFDIIPPNANDEYIERVMKNGEQTLDELKAANITKKSIILTSKAPEGLNLRADTIVQEFTEMKNIYDKLSDQESIDKGYVQGFAKDSRGEEVTTKANKLYTRKTSISNKPKSLFKDICKDFISNFLS